jgi:hypothetical protein
VFHRPHPRPEIRRKTIADIKDFLERAGVTPDKAAGKKQSGSEKK